MAIILGWTGRESKLYMYQSRAYQAKGIAGADTRMGVCLPCSRQIKDKEVINVHSQLNIFKYLLF